MADTFTEFLNLTRPEVGASRDSWGEKWNQNATALDNWAKATDKLAKDAVSKTSGAAQSIVSPLNITGFVNTLAGMNVPIDKLFYLGNARLHHSSVTDQTYFQVAGSKLNITDGANTYNMMQLDPTGLYLRGQKVWDAGTLDPAIFANKTIADAQRFVGPIEIDRPSPYFDLTYGGVMRVRQIVGGDGRFNIVNGDIGDNWFSIGPSGDVSTKQLGDLSTRIENRANAYASSALSAAKTYADGIGNNFNNYIPKSGANINGTIYTQASLGAATEIYADGFAGRDPLFRLFKEGVGSRYISLNSAGEIVFKNGDNTASIYIRPNGSIYSTQMGDINERIETRAAAFADNRLASANAYTNSAFTTFRNTYNEFTQDQRIAKNNPELQLLWGGVARWGAIIRNNGRLALRTPDDDGNRITFGLGGEIWTKQLGDLNDRIEARGAAYRDAAISDAVTNASNNYFPKNTGDRVDITSRPVVHGSNPFYELVFDGVARLQITINSAGEFVINNSGAANDPWVAFKPNGAIWTKQFGDLNDRIYSIVNTRITRLAYAGDVGTDWKNGDGAFNEPFFGACCTGVRQANNQITGHRWRYIQIQGTDGNWYGTPFV